MVNTDKAIKYAQIAGEDFGKDEGKVPYAQSLKTTKEKTAYAMGVLVGRWRDRQAEWMGETAYQAAIDAEDYEDNISIWDDCQKAWVKGFLIGMENK
jgi:hypothetical protein